MVNNALSVAFAMNVTDSFGGEGSGPQITTFWHARTMAMRMGFSSTMKVIDLILRPSLKAASAESAAF